MLRTGYSSQTILEDLVTHHFNDRFDSAAEKQLVSLHASPALIEALKSGQYAASDEENRVQQEVVRLQAAEAKRAVQEVQAKVASQQRRSQQQSRVVIAGAPSQSSGITFQLPSERVVAEKAAKEAKITEHKAYCAEHPTECNRQQTTIDTLRDSQIDLSSGRQNSLNPFQKQQDDFEIQNRVQRAVERARDEERFNARQRANGGGTIERSSNSFSSIGDDLGTQGRIQRAVEAVRREERSNAQRAAYGGAQIHSSAGSFDPGPEH